ncbi:hypothetical protein [Parabacteroides sp.]|nr:hypothetical protein [Parabacteroides sp.]MDO5429994.1 hypothetical protein [Parabacteroides sp.]
MVKEEYSKLEELALSDLETLLDQDLDELVGGYYDTCNCGLFGANA